MPIIAASISLLQTHFCYLFLSVVCWYALLWYEVLQLTTYSIAIIITEKGRGTSGQAKKGGLQTSFLRFVARVGSLINFQRPKEYIRASLNKTRSPCLHSMVKTGANVWEISRANQLQPETQSRVFTCSKIFTNFAEVNVFNRLWRHGEHVLFLCFYKIVILQLNKEKDKVRNTNVWFISFMKL